METAHKFDYLMQIDRVHETVTYRYDRLEKHSVPIRLINASAATTATAAAATEENVTTIGSSQLHIYHRMCTCIQC